MSSQGILISSDPSRQVAAKAKTVRSNQVLINQLSDGAAWLADPSKRFDSDHATNVVISSLIVLSQSEDWGRYKSWIARTGLAHYCRDISRAYRTKAGAKAFAKLVRRYDRERQLVGSTVWSAFNAFSGVMQHDIGTSAAAVRTNSRLFGRASQVTQKAFQHALSLIA